jgi:hypothetical protein
MVMNGQAPADIKYILLDMYDPDTKLADGTYDSLIGEEEVWCVEAIRAIRLIIEKRNSNPNTTHVRKKKKTQDNRRVH